MPGNPLTDPNWAPDLADTIDGLVGTVRDRVTDKAVTAVRGIVFGVIAAITSVAIVSLVIIVTLEVLQEICQVIFRVDHATSVWISYFMMSGILLGAGALAMHMRHTKPEPGL